MAASTIFPGADEISDFAAPIAGGAALGGVVAFMLAETYRWFGYDPDGATWVYYGVGLGGVWGLLTLTFGG